MSEKKEKKKASGEAAAPWITGKIMRKRSHSTGLVDFDYWVYAFLDQPVKDPGQPFRRGCIWA